LEKLNNDLHNKNKTLEDKNLELQIKYDDNKKILKFTQGQENLDKLLCTQKAFFNKEGIGYNHLNKNTCYKNFFVKPTLCKRIMKPVTIALRSVTLHIHVHLENLI